jgi:hypothetical protein
MPLSPFAILTAQAVLWLQAYERHATPGHWVALFGSELLAVLPTLREVVAVLARTPLPGPAFIHQFKGRSVMREHYYQSLS